MLAVLVPWPFCVNFRIVLSIATKCLTEVLAEIVLCLCCVRQHLHRRHRSVCMWCPSACSLLCLLSSVLRGSQPWARVLLITPKHFSFWAVVNGIILFYLDDNILISGVRNTVDFCMFTLFSVSYWSHTSVKEEIFDVCFWIESFGFSAQMSCHLQMRIVSLSLSLSSQFAFISSCIIPLARTSRSVQHRVKRAGILALLLIWGEAFSFSPSCMVSAVSFLSSLHQPGEAP